MSEQTITREVDKLDQILAKLLARKSIDKAYIWMRWGCVGLSAMVFIAWQFALRDGRTLLADPSQWQTIDHHLPRRAYDKTRRWLEKNFILRYDDLRVRPWTIVTSAFSHVDFYHFAANTMSFNGFFSCLGVFLSPIQLAGCLLSSTVGGSVAYLEQQRRKLPSQRRRALGMSGMVTGMGVAAGVLNPWFPVSVFGLPMPLWVGISGYIAWDTWFLSSETSTTGHSAHLGGAAAGLLYGLGMRYGRLLPLSKSNNF